MFQNCGICAELQSTETLNVAVTDILLEAMDNKQLSIVIFLNMSTVFDSTSVHQDMLLQRILKDWFRQTRRRVACVEENRNKKFNKKFIFVVLTELKVIS